MTVSGLVIPPVQNSVQSLSIWLRSVPVIMPTAVPSFGGWNDSMILMMLAGLLLVGEQAVDAVGVERRERRLVQPGDLDGPVLGDVVLEQVQEPDLRRVQRRVLLDEGREPLVDRRRIQADDAADGQVELPGAVGVVFHQVVQVEHRVLGQHQRGQRLQVGLADRLARLDPLERLVRLEQVLQHLLDPVAVGGKLQAFELDGVLLPLDQGRVFLDVDDLRRQRRPPSARWRYCMTPRSWPRRSSSLATVDVRPEVVGADLGDGRGDGLHLGQVHRRSSSLIEQLGLQVVEAARPLQVFGLQAADEQVELVRLLAAADVPPLHERGDLVQEHVLRRRVELPEHAPGR